MKKIQRSKRKITKRFAIVDITRFRVMIFGMHNWSDLTPECICCFCDGGARIIVSLSNSVFERRTSTGSGLFASLRSGLVETLG